MYSFERGSVQHRLILAIWIQLEASTADRARLLNTYSSDGSGYVWPSGTDVRGHGFNIRYATKTKSEASAIIGVCWPKCSLLTIANR